MSEDKFHSVEDLEKSFGGLGQEFILTAKIEKMQAELAAVTAARASDRRLFLITTLVLLVAAGAFWGILKYHEFPAAIKAGISNNVFYGLQRDATAALNQQKLKLLIDMQGQAKAAVDRESKTLQTKMAELKRQLAALQQLNARHASLWYNMIDNTHSLDPTYFAPGAEHAPGSVYAGRSFETPDLLKEEIEKLTRALTGPL